MVKRYHYSCEISLSLDAATKKLDALQVRYRVPHETVLSLYDPPALPALAVLRECGFDRIA